MSSQRLLHIFPGFNVGGVQARFAALAEALGDRFSHSVISLSGNYDAASLLKPGAPVELCRSSPPPIGNFPQRLAAHRADLRAIAPDLLVTYNWGSIEAAIANFFGATPHIHMEDGFGPDEAKSQFARRIWIRHLALSRSRVVVPSLKLKDVAARTWRLDMRNVHYIPNGLAPQASYSTSLESLGLGLPAGLPRIVWVGALRSEKNPIRLLQAFAPIKDQTVLLLIGDGPERTAIELEAERLSLGPSLRLLGSRTDARDLIMQCDVMALSSDTEQMPFAILEGMDAGLPVASVDVGDVRHMVASENHPFITAPSTDALAGALRTLVTDAALRKSLGQANRIRLRETYSLDGMANAHGALFDRMIAGRGDV